MKNLTRKLMVSIITAVFALVTLGTTTFAWFTTSNVASTGKFEGQVQGGEGFEIAIVNKDKELTITQEWYTGILPQNAIEKVIGTEKTKLSALTLINNGLVPLTGGTPVNNGFITFDLWFRTAKSGQQIESINKASTTSDGTETATSISNANTNIDPWYSDQEFTLSAMTEGNGDVLVSMGKAYKFDVASAARIMIKGTSTEEIIYENTKSNAVLNDGTTTTIGEAGNSLGFCRDAKTGAVKYYNQKMSVELKLPTENIYTSVELGANSAAESTSVSILEDASKLEAKYFAEGAQTNYGTTQMGKVTVTIWVEGWDGECMNAIFNQTLKVVLGFKMSAVAKA